MDDWERLKECVDATQKRLAEDMARMLYAPNPFLDAMPEPPPRTLWQRWLAFCDRAKDAWLVLTGRLDPYDY